MIVIPIYRDSFQVALFGGYVYLVDDVFAVSSRVVCVFVRAAVVVGEGVGRPAFKL